MSIKSKLKTAGKIALKVAPIAAMFIPGVGPLASMAISAASNAASKKIEGGTWKQSLISGGIGAAEGYGAGAVKAAAEAGNAAKAANAAKGLAPTASAVSKGAKLATVMNDVNKGISVASPILGAIQSARSSSAPSSSGGGPIGNSINYNGVGMSSGATPAERNPNFADALNKGNQLAMANQPYRAGYDVNTVTSPTEWGGMPQKRVVRMPPIYPNNGPLASAGMR